MVYYNQGGEIMRALLQQARHNGKSIGTSYEIFKMLQGGDMGLYVTADTSQYAQLDTIATKEDLTNTTNMLESKQVDHDHRINALEQSVDDIHATLTDIRNSLVGLKSKDVALAALEALNAWIVNYEVTAESIIPSAKVVSVNGLKEAMDKIREVINR